MEMEGVVGRDGMSEYERERQKRIEENRKMLEELFPEGTGLSVPVRRLEKDGTPESKNGGSAFSSPVTPRTRTRCVFSLSLSLSLSLSFLFSLSYYMRKASA